MQRGKLILTSQGLNTKTGRELIKEEISKDNILDKRILLIYEPYFSIEKLLLEACKWLGFAEKNIYLYHQGLARDVIKNMDYIYVTEGNTFDILAEIKREKLVELIQEAYFNGAVYIGASAGAVIAGRDVEFAREFDNCNRRELDYEGLGLVNGIVIPHQSREGIKESFSTYATEQLKKFDNIYTIEDGKILII